MLSPCYQLARKGDTVSGDSIIFISDLRHTNFTNLFGFDVRLNGGHFHIDVSHFSRFSPSFSYFKVDLWVISLTRLDLY